MKNTINATVRAPLTIRIGVSDTNGCSNIKVLFILLFTILFKIKLMMK
jgi:hypothetical protein